MNCESPLHPEKKESNYIEHTETHSTAFHPCKEMKNIATKLDVDMTDKQFAEHMDKIDPLRDLRKEFHIPKMADLFGVDQDLISPNEECIYFCGNSMGLCPRKAKTYSDLELNRWAKLGIQGHLNEEISWTNFDEHICKDMAKLVGAKEQNKVAIINGLTLNLHLLLISFYRPTQKRHKILCESQAFSSDLYAFESQIRLWGYNPETSLIYVTPRQGEDILRTEDILKVIEKEGDSIAVICFGGVQYYTGQVFNMEAITKAGHSKGCFVGFDLAHAVGNIELSLHDWNVDFASWCTYKYLNSGPGALGCIFLHQKHENNNYPKLEGWWGHRMQNTIDIDKNKDLSPGANGYKISNTALLSCQPIKASMEIFNKTSMFEVRRKSKRLTAYLEFMIKETYLHYGEEKACENEKSEDVKIQIITPADPEERGAQLSIRLSCDTGHVMEELKKRGVVCDERKPSVIRIAPVPLYCTFMDVHRFVALFDAAVKAVVKARHCRSPT